MACLKSLLLFSLTFNAIHISASELLTIDFHQEGEVSFLELMLDNEEVKVKKFHVTEDKQIIIDLEGVEAKERVKRAFDTSEFSGSIVFVSTYKKPGNEKDTRIAIQLRDNVRSIISRSGRKIILEIENRFGVFTQTQISDSRSFQDKINEEGATSFRLHIPKSDSLEDILANLTLSGKKKYIGKRISFNVRDVSVEDLLNMIANASGFNIITTKELKSLPTMSLNLTNIPWDQSLDTILGINKLVATKNGSILMVTSLEKATNDKKKEAEARKVAKKEEPLVTKIFPISYSKIKDLSKILKEYLTKGRGKISLDNRTNSIIVKDIPSIIEKMRKIVEVLDTQTPQVLIESKIVEVKEKHSKSIGLTRGLSFGYDPIGANAGGTTNVGGATSDGVNGGPGFAFSSAPDTGFRTALGMSVKRLNRLTNLNFTLELMEYESKLKIVASPKVITQNKQKASISTTDSIFFDKISGIGADRQTTFEEAKATLSLDVTPQVTNEGSISLDIELNKEQFGQTAANRPPPKSGRKISTNVLVENGSTIMLGGVFSYQKNVFHSGIPFLKDIPLIGWLFRTPHNPTTEKNEIIIFLTPRIINQEEAGLSEKS